MVQPIRVLITDGEQRTALAAARSLGREGHHVFVCSSTARSLTGASRYVSAQAVVPKPVEDPAGYVEAVSRCCAEWRIDMVLPITDQSLAALLPARDRLGAPIPWPSAERFAQVSDKYEIQAAAAELGIAIPRQHVLARSEDRASLDADALHYPIVVKPSRSLRNGEHFLVRHVPDATHLRAQLDALSPNAYPVLLQERIVGPGVGIFLLVWDGVLLASFSHRRLREQPPSGGSSVYCESIAADGRLVRLSKALLDHFDWRGVAMIEFKVEASTGIPYLLEVNGRFWGSLQLAIAAGVDFPVLLVNAARGLPVGPLPAYSVGIRMRSGWRDVDHLLARIRWSPRALALPPDAPSRWEALVEFLRWRRVDRPEILALSDPMPFLHQTVDFLLRRA
jgi:predicted ATP-grasp superfamily ATP-dependent carboligase